MKTSKIKSIKKMNITERTVDISVSGDNLFYANNVLTHNSGSTDADFGMESIAESFGINATADMIFGLISTEVLEKNGLLCVKQLKNRHKDPAHNKRFAICVNKPKMKFSEADAAAQSLLATGAAGVATLGSGTATGHTGPVATFPTKSIRHGSPSPPPSGGLKI